VLAQKVMYEKFGDDFVVHFVSKGLSSAHSPQDLAEQYRQKLQVIKAYGGECLEYSPTVIIEVIFPPYNILELLLCHAYVVSNLMKRLFMLCNVSC